MDIRSCNIWYQDKPCSMLDESVKVGTQVYSSDNLHHHFENSTAANHWRSTTYQEHTCNNYNRVVQYRTWVARWDTVHLKNWCETCTAMGLIHRQIQQETKKRNKMPNQKRFTYMKIVRRITTLRPSTLVALSVGCIGAVASTKWRKGINCTGWSLHWTIYTTVLKTALGPTLGVASFIRSVGAITISGHTNVTHGLQGGTLCVYK
jgi:hypothetical protein